MVHAILSNLNISSGHYNFVQKKEKGGNHRDTGIQKAGNPVTKILPSFLDFPPKS